MLTLEVVRKAFCLPSRERRNLGADQKHMVVPLENPETLRAVETTPERALAAVAHADAQLGGKRGARHGEPLRMVRQFGAKPAQKQGGRRAQNPRPELLHIGREWFDSDAVKDWVMPRPDLEGARLFGFAVSGT